jgi:hypothetical protein
MQEVATIRAKFEALHRIWMSDGVGCGQPPKRWRSGVAG